MKKVLKVLLILGTALVLIAVGFFALVINQLPSLKSVGDTLKTAEQLPAPASPALIENPENLSVVSSGDVAPAENLAATSPAQVASGDTTVNSTLDTKGLDNLMDESRPLSQFCNSLKNARAGAMDVREFDTSFKKSLFNDEVADPRVEAMLPLFRYMFRTPALKDLISDVREAIENQEDGFLNKASFYAKAALAFQDLTSRKPEFEALADRGYLMVKMNELVAQRPELLQDQRLLSFCEQTEHSYNANEPVNYEQEKKNFERVLSEMQVDSKDIGYNPNYKTQFDIKFDGKSINLKGGWLEDVLKAPGPQTAVQKDIQPQGEPSIGN